MLILTNNLYLINMSKKISQFEEITNLTGNEYTIVAYPNLNNKKIKLTNIVKVDSTVS